MEKSINLRILEAKQEVMNTISNSKLPAMVITMMLGEVSSEVQRQTQQIVDKEQKEFDESRVEEQEVETEIVE